METASGVAMAVKEAALESATLEISMATAGAATERSPLTAAAFDIAGDPVNGCANWICSWSARRWLASA
jgi:hypothetical protein